MQPARPPLPKLGPLGLHDVLGNAQEMTADLYRLRTRARAHGQVGGVTARGGSCLTAEARVRTAERDRLRGLYRQAPGFICVLGGPDHVYELVNEAYYQLVGHRDIEGKPMRIAMPELEGQGFFELLDEVYRVFSEDHLLALRPPDLLVELQNWYFTEFERQGNGEEPLPWSGPTSMPPG